MIVKNKKQTNRGRALMEWQMSGRTETDRDRRNIPLSSKTGLASGTLILTADGELPVEYINPGDRIVSRNQGMAVVRNVRSALVKTRFAALEPGALGNAIPPAAAMLPVGQTVLVRDDRAQATSGKASSVVQGELFEIGCSSPPIPAWKKSNNHAIRPQGDPPPCPGVRLT